MPSKLYGVLASGTPALVLADSDCELARVVADHDLGTVVSSMSTDELVNVIRTYADSPDKVTRQGTAARAFAIAHCGRDRSTGQIRHLLEGLVRVGDVGTIGTIASNST